MRFVGAEGRIGLGPPDGIDDDKMFGVADDPVGGAGLGSASSVGGSVGLGWGGCFDRKSLLVHPF